MYCTAFQYFDSCQTLLFKYLSQFEFDIIQTSNLLPGHWRQLRPAQAAPETRGLDHLQCFLEVMHAHQLLS